MPSEKKFSDIREACSLMERSFNTFDRSPVIQAGNGGSNPSLSAIVVRGSNTCSSIRDCQS